MKDNYLMAMDCFGIFDSHSSIFFFSNNLSSLLGLILIPMVYWFIPSRISMGFISLLNYLIKEMGTIMGKMKDEILVLKLSLFLYLVFNNFFGLFPYIFTSSSHLVFSLGLALPLWMSFMIYGWLTQFWSMMSHLTPQGTPMVLAPMMVLVELVSLLIRPITLSVRLAANMVAGHLLLSLLGSVGPYLSIYGVMGLTMVNSLLLVLEYAVSVIQGYVFMVLIVLYFIEVK
uniref:ATP synthase F0 subunit 6 n=1 Tax=Lophogaster typicus TaxID=419538 RepID=UPI002176D62C|nr:ATP synthase F0 subunit 6 [Lophogaster typicus]UUL70715.1 ATP synthase F0 subunit 6 [Lophogaster typicus]